MRRCERRRATDDRARVHDEQVSVDVYRSAQLCPRRHILLLPPLTARLRCRTLWPHAWPHRCCRARARAESRRPHTPRRTRPSWSPSSGSLGAGQCYTSPRRALCCRAAGFRVPGLDYAALAIFVQNGRNQIGVWDTTIQGVWMLLANDGPAPFDERSAVWRSSRHPLKRRRLPCRVCCDRLCSGPHNRQGDGHN